MQIEGTIPFAALQAHGMQREAAVTKVAASSQASQLVAGQVAEKVSFDEVDPSSLQSLQLYTRSADRIEAATRVASGQQLNIQL